MTRSILCGVLALISVAAVGIIPVACDSGGVGDPCTPEEEYQGNFAGFDAKQVFIESSSFNCSSRLCLVNHFQGRVSCPYGQLIVPAGGSTLQSGAVTSCTGPDDQSCGPGLTCVSSANYGPECQSDATCQGGTHCSIAEKRNICECDPTGKYPVDVNGVSGYYCNNLDINGKPTDAYTLKTYVCHEKGKCQSQYGTDKDNTKAQCCIPGTDTPVSTTVCPQCKAGGKRSADQAVYCSCRCLGPKDKAQADFNYCSCPSGYACEQLRADIGLGQKNLTGSYCVKQSSIYAGDNVYDPNTAAVDCGASNYQSKDSFTGQGCGGI